MYDSSSYLLIMKLFTTIHHNRCPSLLLFEITFDYKLNLLYNAKPHDV